MAQQNNPNPNAGPGKPGTTTAPAGDPGDNHDDDPKGPEPEPTPGPTTVYADPDGIELRIVEAPAGKQQPATITLRTPPRGPGGPRDTITFRPGRRTLLETATTIVEADTRQHPGNENAAEAMRNAIEEIDRTRNDPAVDKFRRSQLAADGITDPRPWAMVPEQDARDVIGRRTWRRRWQAAADTFAGR